ncbi:MAG: hypothetical protein ACRD18_13840, partial [Terriglobia bacterium]
ACTDWQSNGYPDRGRSILIPSSALPPLIQDKSPMRECRPWGSVRGAAGNRCPYRDPDMASYRSKDRYDKNDPTKLVAPAKARPYYYAEQTVTKAMASLGMTKHPVRTAKAATSSR